MKRIIYITKFNFFILILLLALIFSSSSAFAGSCNAGFIVKCGNLYGCFETLAIAHENLVPMNTAIWNLYKTLENRGKIYSDDDYKKLKGKWLGLTLRKGNTYIDVPAIHVSGKTSVFKMPFSKFAHFFSSGEYLATVAGWEDYDSENDKMVGEIWRLNCDGKSWIPLIRYDF